MITGTKITGRKQRKTVVPCHIQTITILTWIYTHLFHLISVNFFVIVGIDRFESVVNVALDLH